MHYQATQLTLRYTPLSSRAGNSQRYCITDVLCSFCSPIKSSWVQDKKSGIEHAFLPKYLIYSLGINTIKPLHNRKGSEDSIKLF